MPLALWYLPVPPANLHVYSLRCEPSSQLSYTLSPPLKVQVQVPLPFQLPSGKYSYLPTQSSVDFDAVGSSGTRTHLPPKSTNLWPLSGSDSSHLSATQTRAPASLMVWPAFAALLPRTRSARGTATNSCLKSMMPSLRFRVMTCIGHA